MWNVQRQFYFITTNLVKLYKIAVLYLYIKYVYFGNYINSLAPLDSLAWVTIITRVLHHQPSTFHSAPFSVYNWSQLKVGPEQPWGLVMVARVSLVAVVAQHWGEERRVICEHDRWGPTIRPSEPLTRPPGSLILILTMMLWGSSQSCAWCGELCAALRRIFIRRELTDNFNGRWQQRVGPMCANYS